MIVETVFLSDVSSDAVNLWLKLEKIDKCDDTQSD